MACLLFLMIMLVGSGHAAGLASVLQSRGTRPAATASWPYYPPEEAYSLALHMHGSMSEQSGSMEWHTAKADSFGVDVIWWTDHDWRLSNFRHMKRYNFEETVWNVAKHRWQELDEGGFDIRLRHWTTDSLFTGFLETEVSDTLAYESDQSLRLWTDGSAGDPDFVAEGLGLGSEGLQHKNSLAKRMRIGFAVFPEELDPVDARFVVQFELSDHPDETKVLRYVLGSMDGEGIHSIPLNYSHGIWNEYELDITADAISHFTTGGIDTLRGEDNSMGLVRISLETRNGTPAVVFFDQYTIDPDPTIVDNLMMDRARAISSYYESLFPSVTQLVGTEISHFNARPHLNGYAPDLAVVDYTGKGWMDSLHYAVEQIHDQDGALSLNHFYGTQPLEIPETEEEKAARILLKKQRLLDALALGVDVLEVGYRNRGGMNLWQHLDLWDVANANAVFLTGNGVTDSHGRGWAHLLGWEEAAPGDTTTNNFVTWLYTEGFSPDGFIRAMKSGRTYFGDPYRFGGTVDLRTLDGFRMGQVVVTDRPQHEVLVEVTGFPSNGSVRLLQTEIQDFNPPGPPYHTTVNLLRNEFLTGESSGDTFVDTVSVSTTTPSFVRIEVYDDFGDVVVLSNPIHFVDAVPQRGVEADRVAARRGDIRVFLAEEFRLTDVDGDGSTGVLTVTGDEATPGLGRLLIDPGGLGAPSGVLGAASWSFQSGILTVSGFNGDDSVIRISWGPTGLVPSADAATELALSPGRPNPFGVGTLAEYAIPAGGWVRLEVRNVEGRRVRTLVLGFQERGLHRVRWDGTDEHGRTVAAGVYWLRLEHGGKSLSRKAVRIR